MISSFFFTIRIELMHPVYIWHRLHVVTDEGIRNTGLTDGMLKSVKTVPIF